MTRQYWVADQPVTSNCSWYYNIISYFLRGKTKWFHFWNVDKAFLQNLSFQNILAFYAFKFLFLEK